MLADRGFYLLLINGALLLGCAVFDSVWQVHLLALLMFFLPFIDRRWQSPKYQAYRNRFKYWMILVSCIIIALYTHPERLDFILYTTVLVAFPEEWYFRGYLLQRLAVYAGGRITANLATSAFFAVMHVPAHGIYGLSVFVPSFIFGWLYQLRQDIVLVVLLHAASNIYFLLYLAEFINDVGFGWS